MCKNLSNEAPGLETGMLQTGTLLPKKGLPWKELKASACTEIFPNGLTLKPSATKCRNGRFIQFCTEETGPLGLLPSLKPGRSELKQRSARLNL